MFSFISVLFENVAVTATRKCPSLPSSFQHVTHRDVGNLESTKEKISYCSRDIYEIPLTLFHTGRGGGAKAHNKKF